MTASASLSMSVLLALLMSAVVLDLVPLPYAWGSSPPLALLLIPALGIAAAMASLRGSRDVRRSNRVLLGIVVTIAVAAHVHVALRLLAAILLGVVHT